MEEIGNESGQRPSVSMPSLDPTDFYATLTSASENPAENAESFASTASADTISILSPSASATLESSDNLTEKISTDPALTSPVEEASEFPSIEGDTFIADHSAEESLIDSATNEHLMSQDSSLDVSETVPQPELDDSQGDDDPSIAIDQFIQKIADEQLSSKRVEERKDEEEIQEDNDKTLKHVPIEEVATEEDKPEPVDTEPIEETSNMTETSAKETEKDKSEDVEEPMEVDGADEEAQKKATKIDGAETMESIEAIQKEIDKIPAKKEGEIAKVQNDDQSESENLESILGDKEPEDEAVALNSDVKLPTIEDSAEVAKDPALIEKAQEEVKKLDILVCGECHNTFYYVEEFIEHKKGKCPETSVVSKLCEAESKPQVWGFVLWKTKHSKDVGDKALASWSLYQKWCKLPQADMNAWITAGQSIQFASKLGNAKVAEVKSVKSPKSPANPPIEFVDSNKENSVVKANVLKKGMTKPVRINSDANVTPTGKKEEFVVEKIMAKRFNPRKKTWEYNIKWENFGHDSNTWEPITNLSHCKKLLDQFEEQLRRMKEEKARQAQSPKGRGRPSNPKPVKPSASNYVPIAPKSIATISDVVGGVSDDYSGNFSRPQRSSKQKAMSQVKEWCGNISDDEKASGLKRKFETDDSDEDYDDKKIKLEEDSDDSAKQSKGKTPQKKVLQKSTKNTVTIKNGGTTQQILPSNILIPDANGVVRINQKQLPSLSSGVYIMSKTAGIIKLDSTTSKVATSGGQTIVKVAPKIGQTQIKIVKKDGNTTKQIIQVAPKNANSLASPPLKVGVNKTPNAQKVASKIRKELKKTPQNEVVMKKIESPSDSNPGTQESDSDDGLEPLPFPAADEPLPDVAEEDKDEGFVLDPETGKIAGIEYVDKPVVIKEEPKPIPVALNEELDNIVKMAAADLSDEDLSNTDNQDDPLYTIEKEPPASKPTPIKSEPRAVESIAPTVKKIVKYTIAQQPNRSSVANQQLNRSDSQGQLKPVQKPGPVITAKQATPQVQQRRVVQQKVINQMVTQRMPGQQARTVVRHVIEPTRPGQGGTGNINVIRKTVATTQKPRPTAMGQRPTLPSKTYSAMGGVRQTTAAGTKVQVYSARSSISASQTTTTTSPVVRRIGNTVVRSTASQGGAPSKPAQQATASPKPQVTRIIQRVAAPSPKKPAPQPVTRVHAAPSPVKPRNVINMPSLTEDDLAPVSTQPKTQTKTSHQAPKPASKPAPSVAPSPVKVEVKVENPAAPEVKSTVDDSEMAEQATDWSSFTMADSENPIYVTGDDGTIYQVAGQNEQGQTILITQGPDGQQQCLLVTNEIGEMTGDEPQPSTSAETVAPVEPEIAVSTAGDLLMQATEDLAVPVTIAQSEAESIQTPLQIKTDDVTMEGIEDVDGVQDQVVAQVVRAEPPSPGGTHKVVVMLPDGNLMVTQVSPEEYASLELE